MPDEIWRVKLDHPRSVAVEPGYLKHQHCRNFRLEAVENVYRDPLTGLVTLEPNWRRREWADDAREASFWRRNPDYWRAVTRARQTLALANIVPRTGSSDLVEIAVDVALVIIANAAPYTDSLVWALESQSQIRLDEGWALHVHGLDDELGKKRNWLYVQWDRFGLHLGGSGQAALYEYTSGLTQQPVLRDVWPFAMPDAVLQRGLTITCTPIPYYGLLIGLGAGAPRSNTRSGSAELLATDLHRVQVEDRLTETGVHYVTDASPLRVAVNQFQRYVLSFATITYPTSGTAVDAPFEPGYRPSTTPALGLGVVSTVASQLMGYTTASAQLLNADGSASWTAGVDRKGRVSLSLSTTDAAYTPFVYGWGVQWQPVVQSRATTERSVFCRSLELTHSADGRVEGQATLALDTEPLMAIGERGDATARVEVSPDGVTWSTVLTGWAKDFKLRYVGNEGAYGPYYLAEVTLTDEMERLREGHVHLDGAFDRMTLSDALTIVFTAAGYPTVVVPDELAAIVVPGSGQDSHWKYAVQSGDDGESVLRKLLIFGRAQGLEYQARYDASTDTWYVEAVEEDADYWTLSPTDHDPSSKIIRYQTAQVTVSPPEANVLYVATSAGGSGADSKQRTVVVTNSDSLTDSLSLDYLGRAVVLGVRADGLTEQPDLNRVARMVADRVMHRVGRVEITAPYYVGEFVPRARARFEGSTQDWFLKRRTVKILSDTERRVTYELETVFEEPIQ